MLYFAYGSNLDWKQMKERCPSARFLCRATLVDHRLAFTRYSEKRKCGVADVILEQGEAVWGVVYQIDDIDSGKLDAAEGYEPGRSPEENAYLPFEMHVLKEGDMNHPIPVSLYVANRQENPPLPNGEYKALIVEGATYWRLPQEYIAKLSNIVVK